MAEEEQKLVKTYGVSPYKGEYSDNAMNRFENLEGIAGKILNHFYYSTSRHAQNLWRILKYDDEYALITEEESSAHGHPDVSAVEKKNLVFFNDSNGQSVNKRFFLQPFVDDAWSEQCSSVYVYVDEVHPTDYTRANIIVTVEAVVHSKISLLEGNIEENDNDEAKKSSQYNPNDFSKQGDIVVAWKNRATVLLKSIIAELNGLYLDGIGYLFIDPKLDASTGAKLSLWNSRSFYGYTIKFAMKMGNVSDDPDIGF